MGIIDNPNASKGPGATKRQASQHRAESQSINTKGRRDLLVQALLQLAEVVDTSTEQVRMRNDDEEDASMRGTSPAPRSPEALARAQSPSDSSDQKLPWTSKRMASPRMPGAKVDEERAAMEVAMKNMHRFAPDSSTSACEIERNDEEKMLLLLLPELLVTVDDQELLRTVLTRWLRLRLDWRV
ncbi:hypothetical protein Daus18300_014480 [Diaporthe australafricana]|uniref:Uncharacterized protein n=1 Tax=Diaporthe australafricana TaxID=127596 RepID=A0ABR3VUZ2_9PEZI